MFRLCNCLRRSTVLGPLRTIGGGRPVLWPSRSRGGRRRCPAVKRTCGAGSCSFARGVPLCAA
eukprot:10830978-Alexandrium_andersonii.AAC.1